MRRKDVLFIFHLSITLPFMLWLIYWVAEAGLTVGLSDVGAALIVLSSLIIVVLLTVYRGIIGTTYSFLTWVLLTEIARLALVGELSTCAYFQKIIAGLVAQDYIRIVVQVGIWLILCYYAERNAGQDGILVCRVTLLCASRQDLSMLAVHGFLTPITVWAALLLLTLWLIYVEYKTKRPLGK